MENRIDFFGKYTEKIEGIHNHFFNNISLETSIDKAMVDRTLVQLNYSEYIVHHPDEPDYYFDLFTLQFNDHLGHIMTAFNKYFFKTREDCNQIIDSLKQSWNLIAVCLIEFSKECKSIYDLELNKHDMLQTAHFLYPHEELINNNVNFQLFKIIYPYHTLEPLLRSWD